MYKLTQTNGFRERYLSFLTRTTRLTPQENVFLNIPINVYGDTLHEYVFACVNYRDSSTSRVGFRDNNMHAACFYILSYEKVGTPLRLHDHLLCLHQKKITVVYYSFSS